MLISVTTLDDYLAAHHAPDAVTNTVHTITYVGMKISDLLRRGALADILGDVGQENVQGEEQKSWTSSPMIYC